MDIKFIRVLITVFSLVIFAVPAFILAKCKVLKNGATSTFTAFLLYACQPFLTFMSFQNNKYEDGIALNLLITAGLTLLVHIVVILIIYFVFKKRSDDAKIRVVQFASVFGNVGYMGLPFLSALFGTESPVMLYGAIVIAVFNLLNWTVGIYLISGDKKYMSLKKAVINPPMLALLISLPLFFIFKQSIFTLGTEGTDTAFFLEKMQNVFNILADMVTPISMTVLGLRLAEMNVKEVFANKHGYIATGIKLFIVPVITVLILLPFKLWLNLSAEIFTTVAFTLSMPCATSTLLFSEQFGGEPHTASASVLLSTIVSIVTIPLVGLLIGAL